MHFFLHPLSFFFSLYVLFFFEIKAFSNIYKINKRYTRDNSCLLFQCFQSNEIYNEISFGNAGTCVKIVALFDSLLPVAVMCARVGKLKYIDITLLQLQIVY